MKAKDLAKKLGVSPATISLVLNNKPGISDSLRKSLLEQIQQMGCEQMLCEACREGAAPGQPAPPKAEGSTDRGGGCRSIAYIIYQEQDYLEDMNDPYNFFAGALEGVEAEAWDNDYCLIMLHVGKHKNVSLTEQLRRAGNVVGAIVHPCFLNEQIERDIKSTDIPCVFMDSFQPCGWQPPAVCVSNRQGMRALVEHLMSLGHRDIGYVYSGWDSQVYQDRMRCFLEAMEQHSLVVNEDFLFLQDISEGLWDLQAPIRLFAPGKKMPTALICANDRQAWRTIKALQQNGLRVPQDISVAGFDDTVLCTQTDPSITSIHNSPQLMGRQCVQLLRNLMRMKELGEVPWLRYELPATLVVRDSTGPVPQLP